MTYSGGSTSENPLWSGTPEIDANQTLRATWPHTTTGPAGVTDEACLSGALGGTRTPNLLIRR